MPPVDLLAAAALTWPPSTARACSSWSPTTSWLASWAFVPGIVIGVVFLPLLFPLSAELLAVVDHTMRPTAMSLWQEHVLGVGSAPASPFARARPG